MNKSINEYLGLDLVFEMMKLLKSFIRHSVFVLIKLSSEFKIPFEFT